MDKEAMMECTCQYKYVERDESGEYIACSNTPDRVPCRYGQFNFCPPKPDKEAQEKILRGVLWAAYCEGRADNKYIPEEVLPRLMEELGYRKPLDRPELEGKIYDIILAARTEGIVGGKTKRFAQGDTDQILALIPELPKEYRGCPKCGSIWVCWNWIQATDGKSWCHECWDCGNCSTTPNKVEDGLPYDFLKAQHRTLLPKDKPPKLDGRGITSFLKSKYPHMYRGNDEAWCRMKEDALLLLLNNYDVELLLEAQGDSDINFYTKPT